MPKYLPVRARLVAQGYEVEYEWSRKAVKNFNLRVRPDGSVAVSSPTRVTQAQIEAFLRSHLDFILKAKAKMAAHHPDTVCTLAEGERIAIFGKTYTVCLLNAKKCTVYTENGILFLALPTPDDPRARVRLFWRFAADEVAQKMREMTAKYAPYFLGESAPMPKITLRRMKSRWGACFYKENRISYNTNLIFMHPACLAYVACHELAHFCHPDHSAAFYACLARVLPNHKELRKYLHTAPVPRVEAE
jgi:predicted metal-dependent hydrolase